MADCCGKLRHGSGILLGLTFLSWVIALGGLGAMNWLVCSDTVNTAAELGTSTIFGASTAAGTDVAVCSRTWRWEWWTLFFTLAIIVSGLVATALPGRLARARFPLANLLSIAAVLIMVSLNSDIQVVWAFWDQRKLFSEWTGVAQKLYMSAAALVAGWVLSVIFILIWIGFALDAEVTSTCTKHAHEHEAGSGPITSDPEAPAVPRK